MQNHPHNRRRALAVALLTVAAGLMAGCGVRPTTAPPTEPVYTTDNPPPFLRTPDPTTTAAVFNASPPVVWNDVAVDSVCPGELKAVVGGRYDLRFFPGSLTDSVVVSIKERDSSVLNVQLGPDGTVFATPVDLIVDFSGTNADPNSSNYDGSTPAVYWHNDETGIWELVPSSVDAGQRTVTAHLAHFSQYGVASKAGW